MAIEDVKIDKPGATRGTPMTRATGTRHDLDVSRCQSMAGFWKGSGSLAAREAVSNEVERPHNGLRRRTKTRTTRVSGPRRSPLHWCFRTFVRCARKALVTMRIMRVMRARVEMHGAHVFVRCARKALVAMRLMRARVDLHGAHVFVRCARKALVAMRIMRVMLARVEMHGAHVRPSG
jgi:hypothetical protein